MDIEKRLFELNDLKFRDFNAKLIPNIDKEAVIGVRTPQLKRLARELFKNGEYTDFLSALPHRYFEENQLHAFIIEWAVETATKKKKIDCSAAEFLTIDEGLCLQIMHIGAFDNEPATVAAMDKFLEENGYADDFSETRLHHEIYMSDARKVSHEKWKTVIRHPIRKVDNNEF